MLPREALESLAKEMQASPEVAFGLANEAIERMGRVGAQEAGSNFATIANQLDWLRYPEMQRQTDSTNFDFASIADGNSDLFVVVPPELVEQTRAWIRLWIAIPYGIATRRVSAARRDLLIVIDEMPRLGYLKPVMDAYTMAAGTGVHFWSIAQSLSALGTAYGERNAEVLMDNAELVQILGMPNTAVRDAERFSAAVGNGNVSVAITLALRLPRQHLGEPGPGTAGNPVRPHVDGCG